jgi:hypothetical protein
MLIELTFNCAPVSLDITRVVYKVVLRFIDPIYLVEQYLHVPITYDICTTFQ